MKLKKILATGILLVALSAMSVGSALASAFFIADLTGDQEVPSPVSTSAFGHAALYLNAAQTRLEISIELFGLDLDGLQTADPSDDLIGLHIHRAPKGSNGPVVFGIIGPDHDTTGDFFMDAAAGKIFSAWDMVETGAGTSLAAELPHLFAFDLYLNVHTVGVPSGEIRGQITPEPGSMLLVGLGLIGFTALFRKRTEK